MFAKFHYANFHQNFQEGKVTDINHESREHKPSRDVCDKVHDKVQDKPVCVALMEFSTL